MTASQSIGRLYDGRRPSNRTAILGPALCVPTGTLAEARDSDMVRSMKAFPHRGPARWGPASQPGCDPRPARPLARARRKACVCAPQSRAARRCATRSGAPQALATNMHAKRARIGLVPVFAHASHRNTLRFHGATQRLRSIHVTAWSHACSRCADARSVSPHFASPQWTLQRSKGQACDGSWPSRTRRRPSANSANRNSGAHPAHCSTQRCSRFSLCSERSTCCSAIQPRGAW